MLHRAPQPHSRSSSPLWSLPSVQVLLLRRQRHESAELATHRYMQRRQQTSFALLQRSTPTKNKFRLPTWARRGRGTLSWLLSRAGCFCARLLLLLLLLVFAALTVMSARRKRQWCGTGERLERRCSAVASMCREWRAHLSHIASISSSLRSLMPSALLTKVHNAVICEVAYCTVR